MEIRPQPGPQTQFLSTPADIAVYGGAAGGGKTFALLLEFLRHVTHDGFNAVIFRRTSDQIRLRGGLWEESQRLYRPLGAKGREQYLDWRFPSGSTIQFDSLQHEKDKFTFQGAQICAIGFDELTHFTESQFFYLLSRNRSTCGVRPYIRATTNPDPHSWVKRFLAPWLDRTFEPPAESGEVRWFMREGGEIRWLPGPSEDAKSVTFVRASIFDNPALLARDPGYLANLKALSVIDRKRLLEGDWDAVEMGQLFAREWFRVVEFPPAAKTRVRFWDLAGTEARKGTDPDYSVGLLLSRDPEGIVYVEDVVRIRERPYGVQQRILAVASQDGLDVAIRMEQEPGSSGKSVIDGYRRLLVGFDYQGVLSTGNKVERAKPYSAHCEAGHVRLISGPWNKAYLDELVVFPSLEAHDDQVDASSGAFRELVKRRAIELRFS